jgi:3-(3-hydroxy-phenyl)propionate hydroxylase
MTETDVDVLIVGGGPVGVTTSLLLAHRGLSVRVLERTSDIYDLPRAIAMDDEIQRVFQNLDLRSELAAITTKMKGAEFVTTTGERIVGVDLDVNHRWPLGHHPTVAYYQPQLEHFLRTSAVASGVDLRLGTTADQPTDHGDHVSIDSSGPDGTTEHHTARWLIAADGAASPVRKHLGIPFIDQGFDQDWLVLDVVLRRPVPDLPTAAQQICDPARPVTFIPGHDRYRRWEFQLLPGEQRHDMEATERVWELLRPWITPDDADLVRAVVYRFHATVAETMRAGSVFLAGDAAHQMPPFLGQGLCSGIRDGANLAWKLDLVHRGRATDALLDTYSEERAPHAAAVVEHAADTGRLIDQLSGKAGNSSGLDAGYGGGRPFPRLEHGLVLGEHPALGRQFPQPATGESDAWFDDRLGPELAIVFDAETGVGDAVDNALISDVWKSLATPVGVSPTLFPGLLPPGGAVVVRPDRYVAAVLEDADHFRTGSFELIDRMGGTTEPQA